MWMWVFVFVLRKFLFIYDKIAKNKEEFNVDLLTVKDYELTRKSYF